MTSIFSLAVLLASTGAAEFGLSEAAAARSAEKAAWEVGCSELKERFEAGERPETEDLAGEHLGIACLTRFPRRVFAARLVGLIDAAEGALKLVPSMAATTEGWGHAPGFYDSLPLTPEATQRVVREFLPRYSLPEAFGRGLLFAYERPATSADRAYRRSHEVRRIGACLVTKDTDAAGLDSYGLFCRRRAVAAPPAS